MNIVSNTFLNKSLPYGFDKMDVGEVGFLFIQDIYTDLVDLTSLHIPEKFNESLLKSFYIYSDLKLWNITLFDLLKEIKDVSNWYCVVDSPYSTSSRYVSSIDELISYISTEKAKSFITSEYAITRFLKHTKKEEFLLTEKQVLKIKEPMNLMLNIA